MNKSIESFKGVFTALVTPFKAGAVDYPSLENLVKHQLKNGIDGFVINGTTAESPSLEFQEVGAIFKKVRQIASNVPLIVGTGVNSTKKTMELTRNAEELGADGALVVVPYYNKPPQRGLEMHFKTIAESTKLPIILYNVPSRTVTSLEPETVKKIAEVKNVIGIKEATGNIS